MGTVYSPQTEVPEEHALKKTEHFRIALFQNLKKHEIQEGFREIANTVRNGDPL